jgi:3-phosphoglycerate kinase
MALKTLDSLDVGGKTVFLRLDLNVPIENGVITDDTRIVASLPTILKLREKGAKLVIASHLGRPKGGFEKKYSLEPVGAKLAELLNCEVYLIANYEQDPVDQFLKRTSQGDIVLLENLRFNVGEEKNTPEFIEVLAKGIDFYVNDAFGAAHRAHASTTGLPEYLGIKRCAAGFLMEKEVKALSALVRDARSPYVVVMGGSKVSDKIGVILSLIDQCTDLMIGGAMAYTFLKYKGVNVGKSKTEDDKMTLIETIYRNAEARRVNIHLPVDHLVSKEFSPDAPFLETPDAEIQDGYMGLDIGPKTRNLYASAIRKAQTVLWNGPMGVFEWKNYAEGSMTIARAMAECRGLTVVGGGDSVAAANMAKVADKLSHVSTGGGASLEYLEGRPLPGIRCLYE